MLATIACVLGSFVFLIVRACRAAERSGERYQPEGKLRWTDEPS